MAEPTPAESGTIYDIGYRHYEGEILGRAYAIRSLVTHDLRTVFAVGRGLKSMLIPLGLAAFAVLPAVVQTAARAYIEIIPELLTYPNYFARLFLVFALFCAARGPALVCADQRTNTLVLYFARALHRTDYAIAKVLALAISVFVLAVTPLLVIFAGRVFASDQPFAAFGAEWPDLFPIAGSAAILALLMASVSLAIASQTGRSRMAAAAVLAYFMLSGAIVELLLEVIESDWVDWVALLNPFVVLGGFAEWAFDASAGSSGFQRNLDIPEWVFGLGCLVYIGLALAVLLERYRRVDA